MTHIEPGLFALFLLTSLTVGGFGVVFVTKLFAIWEEKVFWKRYELLEKETQNV